MSNNSVTNNSVTNNLITNIRLLYYKKKTL